MQNHSNVIQNPLLAAVQEASEIDLEIESDGVCTISITDPDLSQKSLLDLIDGAREQLRRRLPELGARQVSSDTLKDLREGLADHYDSLPSDDQQEYEDNGEIPDGDDDSSDVSENDIGAALFNEETQVVDFYDELNARSRILNELGDAASGLDVIGGFSRAYLESLLRPVVLVDGQHRLLGALASIELERESDKGRDRQAKLMESVDAVTAADTFSAEVSRRLPISLLATESPAEHVFQFVVVNQKATPMSNALLGTIVSTSLTNDELDKIAVRLSDAGIKLDASRAVAYLTRAPRSPFCGLVSTGISGDRPNSLPWSVLLRLANMVRELEGGKSFHPPPIDYVKTWARNYISLTGLIPGDAEDRQAYWRQNDGPWRELFIRLHSKIRDYFGDLNDMAAANAWGSTQSNLFNMVSLTILTQDFFAYLREASRSLVDWADVDKALDDWLSGLNRGYFNRDWRMEGTKKDQPAIKHAWSSAWFGYRVDHERLPRVEVYNPGGRRGA